MDSVERAAFASDPAHGAPLADAAIFWLVNGLAYLRYPNNVRRFRRIVGYFPNIARPVRYNEKMLWRKIFDHNPLFVTFSDKLATKAFIAGLCPKLRSAEVLWIGDDVATIPADVLERPIVIKASHGWAQNFFPKAGEAGRDIPARRINRWLGQVYGRRKLEWAYGLVERKLFAEELIVPDHGDELVELAVHAFDGAPAFIEAIVGNNTPNRRKGYFRTDGARWSELERKRTDDARHRSLPEDFRLPPAYAEAFAHTRRLSSGVDYARFDFFVASDRLYAGEITVYPGSGTTRHADFLVYNAVVSEQWDLSKSWFLLSGHRGLWQLYAKALGRFLKCGGGQQ